MKAPKLIDNKTHKMIDEIKDYTKKNSKISMISASFTLFAFESLKKELSKIDEFKFIFTEPTFVAKKQEAKQFFITKNSNVFGSEFEIKLRNKMTQSSIAKECAKWIKEKATFKTFKKRNPSYPRMMHIENEQDALGLNGTVDFSADSLGIVPSERYENVTAFYGKEFTKAYLQSFDNLWNDDNELQEVTDLVIKNLEYIHKENPPEFMYYLTIYNIFYNYLNELTDDRMVKEKTGIKDTLIWNKLYEFQKDGALGAIEKMENYNGCIIADSVGLGKTFSALAIIKYYELRNYRVLVLCPKKLRDNWLVYTMNDKRNLFVNDRFSYDVLNHTDLNRESGFSGDINLSTIHWENYDLVVIDESHNFRNNPPVKDRMTRYQKLMQDVIKSGVQTKVLMLSATPVNNKMNDIKNQIAFITEENDRALNDVGIESIDYTLKNAQAIFNQWSNLKASDRTTERFIDMMNMDYFKILDTLTIARSRKHIEKYYDVSEIGAFPERLPPKSIYSPIDEESIFPDISEVNNTINRLNLAVYSPLKYVYPHKLIEYERKYDMEVQGGKSVFKQADRETSLIHLMRINLLKRLESSIHSFKLTITKLLEQVDKMITMINKHEENFYSGTSDTDLSILDIDPDDTIFEDLLVGNRIKVLLQDTDTLKWKQELQDDQIILKDLLSRAKEVKPKNDGKLNQLKDLLIDKLKDPINKDNHKIIIFTTFSDTAHYLYENLAEDAKKLNLNTALVVGSGANKSTIEIPKEYKKQLKLSDINNILTLFSPQSKEMHKIFPNMSDEIDILIATDCISEGQNLQDCDYVVNYDIHWNPVRIIQRFGRVDRIGSQNEKIQLVNFWPTEDLDEYINLEQRVKGRMVMLDTSATGEENVLDDKSKEMQDLEYRREQLLRLQNEVVDLEDISGGISITDLSFSDFRVDLTSYLKHSRKLLEESPTGLHSIVEIPNQLKEELEPGVIFLLEQVSGKVNNLEKNPLYPYYLIYITDKGEIKYSYDKGKQILDFYRKLAYDDDYLNEPLIQAFNEETQDGSHMSYYSSLLKKAIDEIVGQKEELGIASLFYRGGTSIVEENMDGLENFELITFLILK